MRSIAGLIMATLLTVTGCGGSDSFGPTRPGSGNPGPTISIYSGDNQVAPKGSAVFQSACTILLDGNGAPVKGVTVTYAVATGGGHTLAPASVTSGADGIAISTGWTLGPNVGTQTLTATAIGYGSVTFTATAQ
jgi:hypothetical protein